MGYIVTAGYVTVQTAVGEGRAWVDVPRGAELPGDVPQEEIDRLAAAGHIEQSEPKPAKRAPAKK